VVKLNHLSFDADVYHINFQNAYGSYKVTDTTKPDYGDSYYYATPASNTVGFEAEGNLFVSHGLSFNFNGTAGQAKYEPFAGQTLANGTVLAPTTTKWVAGTPNYTVGAGMTYQDKSWDLGFFNKQIGPRWMDNGSIHEATQLDSFWMNNIFLNYTMRRNSFLDGSKIKLSMNNLFDFHDVVSLSPGASGTAAVPFTPNSQDQLQLLSGRCVMVTFQLGLVRREK
jgi:iron complex outermembrane receptor protein